MYDQILFPTDGSEGADVALEHVLDVAERHGASVHVLNVADTKRDSVVQLQGEVIDALEEEGEDVVQRAAARATERRVDVVTEVLQGAPDETIVDYADSRDVDLIVLPTHGRRGLPRFLLGSVTERVLRRSPVPVLTMRPAEVGDVRYPYEDVLVPTDGSECARDALSVGADVALDEGADLHLLSVIATTSLGADVRTDVMRAELEASANRILEEAAESASAAGVDPVSTTVEYGPSIHEAILSYIEERNVDLVVVGTHGRTGLGRYLLGSVTDYLVRTSPVPVLTVRGGERAE